MSGPGAGKYICFSLGNEKFAMPLLHVKEVVGNLPTTPIPQSPVYFKGILNLRGQIVSIFDLRAKLKIGKPESTPETTIVILNIDSASIGMIVDSVNCVADFSDKDLSESPDTEVSVKADYVTGVARTEDALILILDLHSIINVNDVRLTKKPLLQDVA